MRIGRSRLINCIANASNSNLQQQSRVAFGCPFSSKTAPTKIIQGGGKIHNTMIKS